MLAKQNMDRTQGTSIFDEEIKDPSRAQRQQAEAQESGDGPSSAGVITATTVKEHVERAVNPDPRWRIRFLKKKVMQMARTDPSKPMPRAQHIRMTEKQHKSASPPLPTSTKKLVHLSHQIVGKTVDEAITQMRFSKKKMAREVKWQLEDARDRAIAAHGMGLSAPVTRDNEKPRKILTKDGRWIEVSDPTTLYVDESWVTKGPWRGMRIQYHARSRMSMMWRPSACKFYYSVYHTFPFFLPFSQDYVTNVILLNSHLTCSKRRKDEDTAARREGRKGGQEGPLGPSPESAGDGAEAVLQLVMYGQRKDKTISPRVYSRRTVYTCKS